MLRTYRNKGAFDNSIRSSQSGRAEEQIVIGHIEVYLCLDPLDAKLVERMACVKKALVVKVGVCVPLDKFEGYGYLRPLTRDRDGESRRAIVVNACFGQRFLLNRTRKIRLKNARRL